MRNQSKDKFVYFCSECGYESKKWMGQCPSCHSWNSFSEEAVRAAASKAASGLGGSDRMSGLPKPKKLSEIETDKEERFDTGFKEFSRVLGGGIVPGSLTLVGGDPGIGKSTLLLQTAKNVAAFGKKVLYVSGEESLRQIKLRADRIGGAADSLTFITETNIDVIISVLEKEKPELCIIDSVQTMYTEDAQSAPGSVTQVRECSQKMMICAKTNNIACFLVGHVTKEGTVAGPRVLEHIVDTVLYFESGNNGAYRILRSAKNRFGSTNEIGVFEMLESGLSEVENPSEYMLSGRPEDASGAVVTCLLEGTRPVLCEIQGLLTETAFGMARRQALGLDYNRLNLLLAVMEKRGGIAMNRLDAYVNIAGGLKINEPAADLAVVMAVLSSYKNISVPSDTIVFGEVGLSGEVRAVQQASERIKEAVKLGFRRIIMPKLNMSKLSRESIPPEVELVGIRYIGDLYRLF